MKTYVYIVLFGLLQIACDNKIPNSEEQKSQLTDTLEQKSEPISLVGRSLQRVTKEGYSLSIYQPIESDSEAVVYLLDPQGEASKAVEKYKTLSDHFSFTLVGINSIQNNMPIDQVTSIWNSARNYINDEFSQLPFCAIAGFSGGGRYATYLAEIDSNVLAVMGCGAGFAKQVNSSSDIPFHYLGVVGKQDFNFVEMMRLAKKLEPYPRRHYIMTWEGKHEWPDTNTMLTGFTWFHNRFIAKGLIEKDIEFVDEMEKLLTPQFEQIPESSRLKIKDFSLIDELQKAELMSFLFQDIKDCDQYISRRSAVYRPSSFKMQLAEFDVLLYQESKLQQEYGQNLVQKDLSWWEDHLSQMETKQLSPFYDEDMKQRILQYCSLQLYFLSQQSLSQGQTTDDAYKYTKLYTMFDRENNEAHYLHAIVLAKMNNQSAAITELKEAIKYGFDDHNRLYQQPEFQNLQSDPSFQKIYELLD